MAVPVMRVWIEVDFPTRLTSENSTRLAPILCLTASLFASRPPGSAQEAWSGSCETGQGLCVEASPSPEGAWHWCCSQSVRSIDSYDSGGHCPPNSSGGGPTTRSCSRFADRWGVQNPRLPPGFPCPAADEGLT